MSKLDQLLEEIQREKASKSEKVEVKAVKTKESEVKKNFPWLNIVLIGAVLTMGYFLFIGRNNDSSPDPGPVDKNVAELTQKYENLYSNYKGQTYLKLAELVEAKTINNRDQLVKNAQAILEKARLESLGKLDEMDNNNLPKESFQEDRDKVVKYLEDKALGFERAGK